MTRPPDGEADGLPTRSRLSRRKRLLVGISLGAVVLSGAGVATASVIKSPAQAAAEAGPPPADVLTVPVERRVLKESVVLRGTVTAAQSVDIVPTAAGGEGTSKAVVTKVLVQPGNTFKAGEALLEVSGRPVFALKGKLPVYRDLKPGSHGEDVSQLQRALASLGHGTGSDAPGTFGVGTKAALSSFYASIGYDPLSAQPDGDEQVKAANEGVIQAERALADARDAASGDGSDEHEGQAGRKQVQRAIEDLAKAREDLAEAQAVSGPMLPASEVLFLRGFPARVDSVTAQVGTEVTGKAMTVSAGELVVKGFLAPHEKGLVRTGQKCVILSELTGATADGAVVSVAEEPNVPAEEGTDGGGTATDGAGEGYPVVIRPSKSLSAKLAGQDVRLTVEAASSDGPVLVVPVSAVSAGADGRTTVTVLGADGDRRRVEVRVSTSGDGYVQVTPAAHAALTEGDRVVVGVKPADEHESETGQPDEEDSGWQ
ncbi:peptidoglycan-binding protein [Streptomyces sp. NPDC006602]|uniref:peptidoglycan-binding protein n=1 Tax=Streptomyces sp. NPDC006602 TaxID=3364751 RepID=UPI0036A92FEB